jgi:hypothetical protein
MSYIQWLQSKRRRASLPQHTVSPFSIKPEDIIRRIRNCMVTSHCVRHTHCRNCPARYKEFATPDLAVELVP